jgi:hypothetical protein
MHQFIAKHREQIVGVLSGFDRVVFRGTLRSIAYANGLKRYLRVTDVLLKDFGRHVEEVSERLKEASVAQARALGRPVTYLPSSQTDKDALARRLMAADGITRGLVGVLSCVNEFFRDECGCRERSSGFDYQSRDPYTTLATRPARCRHRVGRII